MSRSDGHTYKAPALNKGLEILELLAGSPRPLTQGEIARGCGRTVNEQFRMLSVLQESGYIRRDEAGAYQVTLKLFGLGNCIHVVDTIVSASAGPMRAYVAKTGQECHLSLLEEGRLIVLAQETGRNVITLHVRKGTECHPFNTASGRLLLSRLSSEEVSIQWKLAQAAFPGRPIRRADALKQIAGLGDCSISEARDESLVGIHDSAVLLGNDALRLALASSWFHSTVSVRGVKERQRELAKTALAIEASLGL